MRSIHLRGWRTLVVCIVWNNCLILVADAALFEGKVMEADLIRRTAPEDLHALVSSDPFVVGPQVELEGFGEHLSVPPFLPALLNIDISDKSILITLAIDQPLSVEELLLIRDANLTIFPITGATTNPATNWAGFTQSRVSTGSNIVQVNLAGLQGLAGQQILLDVSGTPEPSAVMLTAIGFGAAWLRSVRRRRNATKA